MFVTSIQFQIDCLKILGGATDFYWLLGAMGGQSGGRTD